MASTTLRLPDDLYAKVVQQARCDHRSVNGQLIWLIERGLDLQEHKPGSVVRHRNGDPRDNRIENLMIEERDL